MSRPLRIAVVGHVDHGKSTVIGRLLSDTGQVRADRLAKVRAQCQGEGRVFEYAFLLDALEDEQRQGITIDITEVPYLLDEREYTLVDTPGHREFLKNMVGGASRADAALLVVDGREDLSAAFHRQVAVLGLLGIRQTLVLINKMDLVGFSAEAFRRRARDVEALFHRLQRPAPLLIPVAAALGENICERATQRMPWYEGPTLREAFAHLPEPVAPDRLPLRFPVQDVYKFDDRRIYAGRVEAGQITVGDEITFYPSGRTTRVTSLEGRADARPGDVLGLTLADPLYIDRGELGCGPSEPARIFSGVEVDLFWLSPRPLEVGRAYQFRCGQAERRAHVSEVISVLDPETLVLSGGAQVGEGAMGRVRLRLDRPLAADLFEDHESTGRFVLVDDYVVAGGGRILADAGAARAANEPGFVFWLTGLSGAGKSTIATALAGRLRREGLTPLVLDGDEMRAGLCRDLTFSTADRRENLRRIAEVAKLFAQTGGVVCVATISPRAVDRELARAIVGRERFAEVFVDTELEVCEARDPKGLYVQARRGEIAEFTGVSAPYEPPIQPEVCVQTATTGVREAAERLWRYLRARPLSNKSNFDRDPRLSLDLRPE